MKLIVAVIRPERLERLCSALRKSNVSGVTVLDGKGFGRETLEMDWEMAGYLTAKTKVEIAVNDDRVEEVIQLIQQAVNTHKQGDGVIMVWELNQLVRIGSNEKE